MSEIHDAVIAWFTKWYTFFVYVAMGLIGKVSYDMLSGKRISIAKALSSTGIALFVGFVSSMLCVKAGYTEKAAIIVPICTLLSEKIMIAVFALNYKETARDILNYWANRFK